ncbi:MAG: hypothetical protein NVSMB1_16160 [Polyangiales bacterium]
MTFREVYEAHYEFVWRALRRLGVPEADATDAVQEVFLVVHRKLEEFQGRSAVTTWLYGISMRVASDRRRRAYVKREFSIGESMSEMCDDRINAFQMIEAHQDLALLEHLLDELPTALRAVFTLFELDEQSCEQIAMLLEIPVGTVNSRLRRARESFQKALTRLRARSEFGQHAIVRGGPTHA